MKGAAQGPCDPNTHFHSQSQNILGHPNPHGSLWGPHLSVPPQITPHTPPAVWCPRELCIYAGAARAGLCSST